MARQHDNRAAETLDDIQSYADRAASWIGENPALVLGVGAAVLIAAAAYGIGTAWIDRGRDHASAELAAVDLGYREAMGASPDSFEITEPANADAARATREEYLAKYLAVADKHAGDLAGATAALSAGRLQIELGQPDNAIATWQKAAAALDSGDVMWALLTDRIAVALEQAGKWAEAAEAHAQASAVAGYPLRFRSLAASARCQLEAGNRDAALAAYDQLRDSAPDERIPDHVRARLEELRAARDSG